VGSGTYLATKKKEEANIGAKQPKRKSRGKRKPPLRQRSAEREVFRGRAKKKKKRNRYNEDPDLNKGTGETGKN